MRLRPDAEAAFTAAMGPFVARSREAEGCLDFQVLRVEADPAGVVLLERWSDPASFEGYLGSEAFALFRERVLPLLAEPPRSVYYEASIAHRAVVR